MEKYKAKVLVTSATVSMVEVEVKANNQEEAQQKAKQAAEDGECIYLWDDEDWEADYKIYEIQKVEEKLIATDQSTKSEYCCEVADAYLRSYFIGKIDLAENYTKEAQEHFNALWDELMGKIEDIKIFNLCTIVSPEDNFYGICWQDENLEPRIYSFNSTPYNK